MPGIQPPIRQQTQVQPQTEDRSRLQQEGQTTPAMTATATAPAPAASSHASTMLASLPPDLSNFFISNPEAIQHLADLLAAQRLHTKIVRELEGHDRKRKEILERQAEAKGRLDAANQQLIEWTTMFD